MAKSVEELKQELATLEVAGTGQGTTMTRAPGEGIADDDPEIVEYLHEWDDSPHAALAAKLGIIPRTLQDARRTIAERRRLRALYAVIVDESKPMAERLETVKAVLDGIKGWHYLKQFSPEMLIERIRPAGSARLSHAFDGGERAVPRPPRELADVWSF